MNTKIESSLHQLAERINAEHNAAIGAARETMDHARRAGELLLEAKRQTERGQWLAWLGANFEFTPRTAQGYMRIAAHWSDLQAKSETVSHLGLREALALLSPVSELLPHQYSLMFPPMSETEFAALKDSLRRNGFFQHDPITLYEGKILDGKERYRACLELEIEPIFQTYEDVIAQGFYRGSPLDYVLSGNLYRQHLNEYQRATIAAGQSET
jgi:hypothetical protein